MSQQPDDDVSSTRRTYLGAAGAAVGLATFGTGTATGKQKELKPVEPATEVTEFDGFDPQFVIDEPGRYVLDSDIEVQDGEVGIFIAASNVTVDGDGNTISGEECAGTGIAISGGEVLANNNLIQNVTFEKLGTGLNIREAFDSQLSDLTVQDCGTGLVISEGESTVLQDSTFEASPLRFTEVNLFAARNTISGANDFGMRINDSVQCVVVNNEITDNGGPGLTGTSLNDSQIVFNRITDNGGAGIDLISGDSLAILSNTLTDNADGPCRFEDLTESTVEGNDPGCDIDR